MLVPGDFFRRKQWSDLFFEHNFELLVGSKKPLKGPKLESPCVGRHVAECILESAGLVRGVESRVVTKERMFVFVVGDSEQIAVYRGQFKYDKEHQSLTEEVLERTRFESAPMLEQALFPSAGTADPEDDASSPRLGQFVLDASAQSLMARLPPKWELLKRSDEGAYAVRINGCNGRPYLLRVLPELHGRWLAVVDAPEALFPDERWVSAVTKTERGTKLTLSRNAEDSAPQVLEIPRVDEAPASLSKAFYTHRSDKYPDVREPCGGRAASVGPIVCHWRGSTVKPADRSPGRLSRSPGGSSIAHGSSQHRPRFFWMTSPPGSSSGWLTSVVGGGKPACPWRAGRGKKAPRASTAKSGTVSCRHDSVEGQSSAVDRAR
jgi:hypothetical protein